MDLIVKMKFGSQLYGTSTVESDQDFKGVFMPSRRQILLGRIPKCRHFTTGDGLSKNTAGDIDEEIYSLHYFIQLAAEGQTVAMDMLHAPEPFWTVHTPLWRAIVAQRSRFYTKQLQAFVAYAQRQAAKYGIKGSRLHAVAQVVEVLQCHPPEKKLADIWPALPRIEHCDDRGQDPKGMRLYQVCGKRFQESARIGYVLPILETFQDEYGERARRAAANENIDWKAVSHALRAAIQIREILTQGTIDYPLRDAPFLVRVKSGQLDYTTQVAPALEALMGEVKQLLDHSPLPDQVDYTYWEDFVCDAAQRHLLEGKPFDQIKGK
jgi:hypothetical protein